MHSCRMETVCALHELVRKVALPGKGGLFGVLHVTHCESRCGVGTKPTQL